MDENGDDPVGDTDGTDDIDDTDDTDAEHVDDAGDTADPDREARYVWRVVEDVHGNSVLRTDENGGFAFEVLPTNYDEHSPEYLRPRVYRTTMTLPAGYEFSRGPQSAVLMGDRADSHDAELVEQHGDGTIDITTVHDDLTLDFALVKRAIPLASTGVESIGMAAMLAVTLMGVGLAFFAVARRRGTPSRGGRHL